MINEYFFAFKALLSRGQLVDADGDGVIDERDLLAMSESEEARRRRGLDERTEIILAATFLVLVILAFIRYARGESTVCYK